MISFWPLAVLLGIIVGSFLNVVILRYNTGKGINGRSECLSCRKQLSWKELVPIFSFFYQQLRCAGCDSRLRLQYPLVEITTGLLFVMVYLKFEYLLFEQFGLFMFMLITHFIIWSLFVVIFVYDLYHTIIPNLFVYLLIAFSLLSASVGYAQVYETVGITPMLILNITAGALFLIPFFMLWDLSEGKWIGLGDGKLAIAIGILLGFIEGISALILAFWIGALVSIGYVVFMKIVKKKNRKELTNEIPFAPFMIIGTLITYLLTVDILNISLLLPVA